MAPWIRIQLDLKVAPNAKPNVAAMVIPTMLASWIRTVMWVEKQAPPASLRTTCSLVCFIVFLFLINCINSIKSIENFF